MDRLADRVVAAEAEGDVGDSARDEDVRQVVLDPAGRLDEVGAVGGVLLDARRQGEDVGVEDDVLGRVADLFGEDRVGPLRDLLAALEVVGLALLVEAHDDDRRAVLAAQAGLLDEGSTPSFIEIELTIGLPWVRFRPVSMTSHLLESIISGTREMSGSEPTRLTKVPMAATPSSMPSSMLMSMTCAPLSTCWAATARAAG